MGDLPPEDIVREAIGLGPFLWGFVMGAITMLFGIVIAALWEKDHADRTKD